MLEIQKVTQAFLSYSSPNKTFVKKLAEDLRGHGIKTWLDDWNLSPGMPLADAMEEGIAQSDVMILALSKESSRALESGTGGVAFEVRIAEGRKFKDSGFRIIGVYIEECELPEKLRIRLGKCIDFTNKSYEAALVELAIWIKNVNADLGPPIQGSSSQISRSYTRQTKKKYKVGCDGSQHRRLVSRGFSPLPLTRPGMLISTWRHPKTNGSKPVKI